MESIGDVGSFIVKFAEDINFMNSAIPRDEKQNNQDPMETLTELISNAIANELDNEDDVILIIKDQLPHPLRDNEIEEYVRRGIINGMIAVSPNSSRTGMPLQITVTGLSNRIRKIIKS